MLAAQRIAVAVDVMAAATADVLVDGSLPQGKRMVFFNLKQA
jgi:hypothetical protein